LIDTLRPWLDQVVIIGGWTHRLYRLRPLAQPLGYPLGRDLPNNPSLATPSTAA
jgi:hypothetical protein